MVDPIRFINYWMIKLGYHLHYNEFIRRLEIRFEFWNVERRLKAKHYTDDKIIIAMQKYAGMRRLASRNALIGLGQQIASLSEKTGVPQWQLRAKLREDFNIDI
jgi:hypothetical protein